MSRTAHARIEARLAAVFLVSACTGLQPSASPRGTGAAGVPATADPFARPFLAARPDSAPIGVHVRLTPVETAPHVAPAGPRPQPIANDDAAALLRRLAGPAAEPPPAPPFRFAPRSLPAPRPGAGRRAALGDANTRPPAVDPDGPLRPVAHSPRGLAAHASQVSVTFSRPMVPLSSLQEAPRGVRLSPAPPGAWRWLDPSTLVFDAVGGLPRATRYTVEVPAGLRSVDGQVLSEPVRWTFTTPPPAIRDVVSAEAPDLARPVLVIVFDQAVDGAAVLTWLRLVDGGRELALRPATQDERDDPRVRSRLHGVPPERSIAVRPEASLARGDTAPEREVLLRVLPGLPSAEGPERTAGEAVHRFRVRSALRVVEHGCGRADACAPGVPWTIRFNGALQPPPDSVAWVQVEPALPGATVEVWHDHLIVLGAAAEGSTYTVRLHPSIATWAGDRLGDAPPLQFEIGPPAPSVWAPGGGLALLRPGDSRYTILVQGADSVRFAAHAVTPAEWPEFVRAHVALTSGAHDAQRLPGREVVRGSVPARASSAGTGEAVLDLDDALAPTGHVVVGVWPAVTGAAADAATPDGAPHALAWVQRGDLLLDVAEDGEALTVRVLSSATRRPLADVALELFAAAPIGAKDARPIARTHTDPAGIATLRASHELRPDWVILAAHRADTVVFPQAPPGHYPVVPVWEWRRQLRAHTLTDRPIYAPGDTVRFAGWLRFAAGVGREPRMLLPGAAVRSAAIGPRGETLADDTLEIGSTGRIEGAVVLPSGVNSGWGHVMLIVTDSTGGGDWRAHVQFQIEEVRRPNFEVDVRLDPGPHGLGDRILANLEARYFTGGGLPGAEVRWAARSFPAWYAPPGADDYAFGLVRYPSFATVPPAQAASRTDPAGGDRMRIDVDSLYPAVTMQLVVEATVTDVDARPRTTAATVLVHPADVYVGLRTPARFVRAGEDVTIETLVVDRDGRRVANRPVDVRALLQDRRIDDGLLSVRDVASARCALRSRETPVRCRLAGLAAGDYVIVATVEDTLGRRSESQLAVRIAGETIAAAARAARDTIHVLPDRTEYAPGDTAQLLINATVPAADALLTLRRAGVLAARTVKLENGAALVRVPIEDAHAPNVIFHVAAVAPDGGAASGAADVGVKPVTRTLDVAVEPRSARVAPGATTTVTVVVTDHAGRPVPGADIVLSGIDEALLALSLRPVTDPLADFYPRSAAAVHEASLRAHLAPRAARAGGNVTRGARRAGAGTITGVVLDAVTAHPLSRARVDLADGSRGAWTAIDGTYRVDGVPAGAHRLEVRADGYVSGHATPVTVQAGAEARTHFLLWTRGASLLGGRWSRRDGRMLGYGMELDELAVTAKSSNELRVRGMATPPAATAAQRETAALLRSNFSPVAAFVAGARTGVDGRVEIAIELPHNLTRYRLRAVASAGERRFGAGEAALTARLPLMVRPMPPRFLNQGDRFALPVLLENRTGAAIEVDVAVRATHAELTGPAGQRVLVPADDRVEVHFAAAVSAAGEASFQVAVAPVEPRAGAVADVAEARVPVLVPIATEAFAAYGQIDDARPVAYPLRLPAATLPGQGRVEVAFSTTAAHGLRDALAFLLDCFFDLPEVRASRILALTALADAPAAEPWPTAMIDAALRDDVASLARHQLHDGGWSLWRARFDADPFVSVHAAHALQRARTARLPVPAKAITDALEWLRRLDAYAPGDRVAVRYPAAPVPDDFPAQAKRAVQAYALYVRGRFGDDVGASAARLLGDGGATSLPAEALAWLLPALARNPAHAAAAAEVRRELSNRIVRSAGTAGVVSPYDAGGRRLFYSPRRSDAVVLAALVDDGAPADVTAALARGLMAHRVRGRWANTQENAFAVAALSRFLSAAEAGSPDLLARAWAGRRLAGEEKMRGRSDDRVDIVIPLDSIGPPGAEADLVVAREGAGRLYYRVAMSYATLTPAPALARGFEITRAYEAVDDSSDVRRDENGTWRVRLGARVRVRLIVANAGPRYHVAVIDPLPAGLEAVNPMLAGNQGVRAPGILLPATGTRQRIDGPFHPEHVNVRAERFEAFSTLVPPGRREISYLALATTPGDFAAPAPRAEEMYATETFGRGAAARLIVEDR